MIKVASSHITGYEYDEGTQTLTIEFHNGKTYDYQGVPLHIVSEFASSSSKGNYFMSYIRDRY